MDTTTIKPKSKTHSPTRTLTLDLTAVALVAAAGAMLSARMQVAPLALLLIAAGVGLRIWQNHRHLLAIPLMLPAVIFMATAWYATTLAFDPEAAQQKLFLIVSGVALYFVLASLKAKLAMRVVIWGLLAICVVTALYFVTQTDLTQERSKLEIVNQIGAILHRLTPQFGLHTPHANLIAAILLLGFPYAVGESYAAFRAKKWMQFAPAFIVTLVLAFSLFMTTSRGAWLALILVAVLGALVYAAIRIAHRAGYSTNVGVAIAINVLLFGFILVLVLSGARASEMLDSVFGSVSSVPRLELYRQVIQLNQDFFWTGAGPNTFSPIFSTYLLLINVPFLAHSHNLYLQVWFEQGIVGLIAFVWFLAAYYAWVLRRRKRIQWMALAGLASVSMMLLHGLVDVPLYFSRVIPLMFIPFGLTIAALEPFKPLRKQDAYRVRRERIITWGTIGVILIGVVVLALLRWNSFMGQFQADLGALAQASAELPQIRVPSPTPPEVRRTVNLEHAEELYLQALTLDPQNRTAHARLGLIALDRFRFDEAVQLLESAYEADPMHRATVKALGYAYVWTGQFDKAEPLLKQIPEAKIELNYAERDWRKLGRAELAANAVEMSKRLK